MRFGKMMAIFLSIALTATAVVCPAFATEQEGISDDVAPEYAASAQYFEINDENGAITFTDEEGEIITVEGLSQMGEEEITGAGEVSAIVSCTYEQSAARGLLAEINRFRTSSEDAWYYSDDTKTTKTVCSNLGTLSYDYKLEKAAMQRAAEVAVSFGHTRPNGSSASSVRDEFGITKNYYGENLGAGTASVYSASNLLENLKETDENYSGQGHRRNLLGKNYTSIGMASVTYKGYRYLVQQFAGTNNQPEVTAALDGNRDVTISIAPSRITSEKLTAKANVLNIETGEVSELPYIAHRVYITEAWPSSVYAECEADPSWTSTSDAVAAVITESGIKKVKGYAEGSVILTGTTNRFSSGADLSIDIAVNVAPEGSSGSSSSSSSVRPGNSSSSSSVRPGNSTSSSSVRPGTTSSSSSSKSGTSSSSAATEIAVTRVPRVSGAEYAAPKDNFAAVVSAQNIGKQVLDFSKVKGSEVSPSKLCMTVIKGSKFVTSVPVTTVTAWDKTAIRTKVDKKTGCAVVAVKKSGSVNFTIGNDIYTVAFIVDSPKASKSCKKLVVDAGNRKISMKELFGTDITAGTITVTNKVQGQATANNKDHTIIICPRQKDTVRVTYQYLNKKYKATIAIK